MKKLFILPAAMLLSLVGLKAQDGSKDIATAKANLKEVKSEEREAKKTLHALEGDGVSGISKDHFREDFGNIDASWKRTKFFDEASFINNGKQTTAYYNWSSELVGTTSPAEFSELPANAQKEINKKYKGYNVDKVFLFDDNEFNSSDMMLYGTSFADSDNYFVEVSKAGKKIVLEVSTEGLVSYFSELKK